jgi:hypothetical protein
VFIFPENFASRADWLAMRTFTLRFITVSELQAYVIEQVRKLTEGGQNPTVRRENLESDFVVY